MDAVRSAAHEEENIWGDLAGDRETRGQSAACPRPLTAAKPLHTSEASPDFVPCVRAQQSRTDTPPPAPGYLVGSAVDTEDEEEIEEVEAGEEVLCQADVSAAARGIVQTQKDVDEASRVAVERWE